MRLTPFDKFVGFSETLHQVGQRIGQAQTAYDKASGQLVGGHGNLVNRVKKLEALGAKTSKQFSQALLDAAAEDEEESEKAPLLIAAENGLESGSEA